MSIIEQFAKFNVLAVELGGYYQMINGTGWWNKESGRFIFDLCSPWYGKFTVSICPTIHISLRFELVTLEQDDFYDEKIVFYTDILTGYSPETVEKKKEEIIVVAKSEPLYVHTKKVLQRAEKGLSPTW